MDLDDLEIKESISRQCGWSALPILRTKTMPSPGWYSKKFNKAGLAYELGIAIYHKLCLINTRTSRLKTFDRIWKAMRREDSAHKTRATEDGDDFQHD
jgi:hypothetical protein